MCRLCALIAGGVQEFLLQYFGKSMALFLETGAGEESCSPVLKQETKCQHYAQIDKVDSMNTREQEKE